MAESVRNTQTRNHAREIDLRKMQRQYIAGGLCLLPFSPFLYIQGQYTRWKVGRLPDAGGENSGFVGEGSETLKLLAIGESTVAGIGAETHADALTGQFGKHLGKRLEKRVEWHAYGVSGITIRRAIEELLPTIPETDFDFIVIAVGANDVFKLSSPEVFRRDLSELLGLLRKRNSGAKMFLANVPMVRDFRALPNPLRYILSRLAKLHHFNAQDLIATMENVYYFDDVNRVDDDFFSDGIHPSAKGYDLWSEAMVEWFLGKIGRL